MKTVHDEVYVLGRDQITRLHDLNGDGEADFYENFNNDTMNSEHFHEFAMDLQTGPDGSFFHMKAARHDRVVRGRREETVRSRVAFHAHRAGSREVMAISATRATHQK